MPYFPPKLSRNHALRNLRLRSNVKNSYYCQAFWVRWSRIIRNCCKDHLNTVRKHEERGERMQAHYLSKQTQNEFVNICAKNALDEILSEIEKSYYYGLIVDRTPDVSHTEQLTLVIRYAVQKTASGKWWKDF